MLLFGRGSKETVFTVEELREAVFSGLEKLGERNRVVAVPPDFTRFHSHSGLLTEIVWQYYRERLVDVLPATGTHVPMTREEIKTMFGQVPEALFRTHDWKQGTVTLGEVPAEMVRAASEGAVDFSVPVQMDRLLVEGKHDLIISIGQVVPHELIGMAGYTKNLFVGTGGAEAINRSHFLGATYGMERIMGRTDTPVRAVMNYFAGHLPIVYVLPVVGTDRHGRPVVRGLFMGDDPECYRQAAALALEVNFQMLDRPIKKCVVYLDPTEFRSTWLGNKSIYRTRMALADDAELVVLAPGLQRFGEDDTIDRLIRRYGYAGTPAVLELVRTQPDLRASLTAAAHLIHGSTEGRFAVTYCPGKLSQKEIESVYYRYAELEETMARYNPNSLAEGFNTLDDGEEIFYISNPALGLWAARDRFSAD
ncbi:MAG: lactate racemase domain-containing protein [Acidobacteriota bacterium]